MNRLLVLALAFMPALALAGDTNIPGRLIIQSTDAAPTCSTATGDGTLCIEGATELQSTIAVAGASTMTGATTFASTVAVTGLATLSAGASMGDNNITNVGDIAVDTISADLTSVSVSADLLLAGNKLSGQLTGFEDLTGDDTMANTDCGATVTSNDDARVITLPNAATGNTGCRITFVNTAAADAALLSISPHSSDGIFGVCCGVNDAATTACVALSGTADKDLEDQKAEQDKGDSVTLISDGSTGWYAVGCVGSGWASES